MMTTSHVFLLRFMNKFLLLLMISISAYADEIAQYKAKYRFESKEITITGIREFKSNNDGYEMRFKASNLFARMYFSSKFEINDDLVMPKNYDIKIRPKFLKRDQLIDFNRENNLIISSGETVWSSILVDSNAILDPLNAQIMIRILINKGFEEFDLNILDIKNGGYKNYNFRIINNEKCIVNKEKYNCLILERYRSESDRIVKYYLAKELDYMFIKIIDKSPERTNTLKLEEILSFR